jgi:hypothetical protein
MIKTNGISYGEDKWRFNFSQALIINGIYLRLLLLMDAVKCLNGWGQPRKFKAKRSHNS